MTTWQRMESALPRRWRPAAMADFVAALEIYGDDEIELLQPLIGSVRSARRRGRTPTLSAATGFY